MQSIRGSIFWMAPEVLKGTGYGRKAGRTVGSRFLNYSLHVNE